MRFMSQKRLVKTNTPTDAPERWHAGADVLMSVIRRYARVTVFMTKLKTAVEIVLVFGLIASGPVVFAGDLWDDSHEQQSSTTGNQPVPARAVAIELEPKEQVGRIADHIRDNYARLRSVRVHLQTTFLDRTVTKREEVTNQLPNGGTVHTVRQPSFVLRERVLLRGDDLFREPLDEDGQYWSFHGGIYTQYAPQHHTAWLRLPKQMPGIGPLDPRNIASMENRSNFVDRLRGDRVLEARPARTPDGQPRLAALMEHTFDKGHKERYRCEFDPAQNDLPTRIIEIRDQDRIGMVLDITYQEVISGTAWFLKQATTKYFGRDPVRSPDSDAWEQATTVRTMGKVRVNEPITDDAFVVTLPPDTRVSDAVHGSSH
jgi:hypothetical protein